MKPFSRLCPQCQNPLVSDEVYCRRCNTYLPASDPDTTTFPPPPPQYIDPPSQNWTQSDLTEGFSGEKIMSPQQHQSALKRLNKPLLIGGSLLGVCLLLGASFLLGKNLGVNQNGNISTAAPISAATTTQVPLIPLPTTLTANPTVQPTPTSLPIAPSGTITKNMLLTCSGCDDPILVTINTITFDPANERMIWAIAFHNVSGDTIYDWCATFTLQDPSGNKFQLTGEASQFSNLDPGQTEQLQGIFTFAVASGVSYTLSATISDNDNKLFNITFDPVQLTF